MPIYTRGDGEDKQTVHTVAGSAHDRILSREGSEWKPLKETTKSGAKAAEKARSDRPSTRADEQEGTPA